MDSYFFLFWSRSWSRRRSRSLKLDLEGAVVFQFWSRIRIGSEARVGVGNRIQIDHKSESGVGVEVGSWSQIGLEFRIRVRSRVEYKL